MIALASDHAGFNFKEKTKNLLDSLGEKYLDFGTNSTDSIDYPDFGHAASESVSNGKCEKGILICGTGIGMSMVANRHENVRAAVCQTVDAVVATREHNNANILCFGQRLVTWDVAEEMIKKFLSTNFAGGRHELRINKIPFKK
ncbi:MAG: ribose 5-phosphate isomerase B [Bacteroidota bacterium]